MQSVPSLRLSLLTVTALLVACGGDGGPNGELAAMPQDTFIKPIVREPLGDADMAGLTMTELALELPWTRNKVSRDPAAGAPAASLRSAEMAGHEGFDRVTFTTDDALPATGYEIRIAEAGATAACGSESHELAAPRTLVVTFHPARAGDGSETWIAPGVRNTSATRMGRAGLLCDGGDTVVWVAELEQGDQVRVLELRDPGRIAVDVR